MGYFTVLDKKKIAELPVGTRIEESDFSTITPSGEFVQLQYHEDEAVSHPFECKPGLFKIVKTSLGYDLKPTEFVKDKILDQFVQTQHIEDKVDHFFNKINVYLEMGFEVPKRSCLLYGPAGSGKTTLINKVVDRYLGDGKTVAIIWNTDAFEAYEIKSFIQRFKYVGVERMILIAEDIGGVEADNIRIKSDSSLLSLLDNQEKTFKLPVYIFATTNYPESFMGNLTNRPNRFDDKIKVGYPPAEARQGLLTFFAKEYETPGARELMGSKTTEEFSPAHIREAVIRHRIYDIPLSEVILQMKKEIDTYKNAFDDRKSDRFGLG